MANPAQYTFIKTILSVILCFTVLQGCSPKTSEITTTVDTAGETESPDAAASSDEASAETTEKTDVQSTGAESNSQPSRPTAEQLLAMRLPADQVADGWIRLFDGHTLFGWQHDDAANWRVENGSIVVDEGKQSLLCTSVGWRDYELTLEFKADNQTNSGVFLRTPTKKTNPKNNCYEVNIAPADNPYPTASVVNRIKVDAADALKKSDDGWNRMTMKLVGDKLEVSVNDELLTEYTDPEPLAIGHIGLQLNSGRVAFRDIRLKPLGLESLIDQDLSKWTKYPEMDGDFTVTDDGAIHVLGGKTQLESKSQHGDFTLLAEYKMDDEKLNSGIFFRAIPGDVMMGYECQVSNETVDGDRSKPADCGAGGVFRRGDARVVAGDPAKWNTIVFAARGNQFAGWVNGIQVSDIVDERKPDKNPRRGLRLEPGTLMIQGHDATTDALYRQFAIVSED